MDRDASTSITPPYESDRTSPRHSAVGPCALLAASLVACKAVHLSWSWNYLWDLLVIAHADLLLAGGLGVVAQAILSAPNRFLNRSMWLLVLVAGALLIAYGVISIRIIEFYRRPLSYPMLCLAGDAQNMASSVGQYATVFMVSLLLGLPLAYLVGSIILDRVGPGRVISWLLVMAMFALAVANLVYASAELKNPASAWRNHRGLASNPHWAIAASALREWAGLGAPRLNEPYPPGDAEDFQPVGDRAAGGANLTLNLPRGPRNLIVIVCESVGTQHLSIYGSKFNTTPRLAAELPNSLIFDSLYSHVTNTANALVSLVLSRYPTMNWREWTTERPDLPGISLADVFRQRGYRTAFISAGDNQYANQAAFLSRRGFETIWDYRDSGRSKLMSWGVEDRATVDMVLRWIASQRGKPFLAVCWTQGTHHPYEPAPGEAQFDFLTAEQRQSYRMGWELNRYLNALHQMDRQIGRLLDELRSRGLADDTIVAIIGDHGEAFGWPRPHVGHFGHVYEEDVHVPLVLWNPRVFRNAGRSSAVGGQVDLAPTLADLVGIPPAATWQGNSLFSSSRPGRAYFYGPTEDFTFGMREANWKYIINAGPGTQELYDLSRDPLESTNLADAQQERCRRFRQRVSAWLDYQQKLNRQ